MELKQVEIITMSQDSVVDEYPKVDICIGDEEYKIREPMIETEGKYDNKVTEYVSTSDQDLPIVDYEVVDYEHVVAIGMLDAIQIPSIEHYDSGPIVVETYGIGTCSKCPIKNVTVNEFFLCCSGV